MKVALSFLAVVSLSLWLGVTGTPMPRSPKESGVKTVTVHGHNTTLTVGESVNPSTEMKPDVVADTVTQYWVCEAVSTRTLQYGWARGGSKTSALNAAKKNCGRSDCTAYSCIDEGCVGLDYGHGSAFLSYARGYGRNDGPKAASIALGECHRYSSGCGTPGYFCAKYIF